MNKRRKTIPWVISTFVCLVLACLLASYTSLAQPAAQNVDKKEGGTAEKAIKEQTLPAGPVDEYDRGTPRSSVKGFFKAARGGDYERAAQYLDLRNLPRWIDKNEGPELARQLKIALDRTLWVDLEQVSADPKGNIEDGLPSQRESIGGIKTPEKTVDILLQRVPREDGVLIWKFSNRTVAEIPQLYKHFGYGPLQETLSKVFPDVTLLGWQLWQWALFLVALPLTYLAALLPTWIAGRLVRRRETEMSRKFALWITGPIRIVLWVLFIRAVAKYLGTGAAGGSLFRAKILMALALTWAAIRLVDLLLDLWAERLQKKGEESAAVLVQPVRKIAKGVVVLFAAILWLDNIGFNVSALLAGLGVGGIAVALAAQDTLKNFFGSVMILLDKPYSVGQRVTVKGHDGVVEEIGLRSTRIRLLSGHLTTVPNDQMANVDVENIGRRPHIRRLTNITVTYNTPPEKIEKAVNIIETILENHEGMEPDFPPRVYFNEFNPDSLNLLVLYWYHPPDYWSFLAFSQRVNLQIMREFEREGIQFAFPTSTTYLTQDDDQPLHISLASTHELPVSE
ncbi:MAG: mechanosensitive ion channel family protein [Syntrophobacterales bacterium]|jgi:MscS family membrane protein